VGKELVRRKHIEKNTTNNNPMMTRSKKVIVVLILSFCAGLGGWIVRVLGFDLDPVLIGAG
jgi:hypothetical protein